MSYLRRAVYGHFTDYINFIKTGSQKNIIKKRRSFVLKPRNAMHEQQMAVGDYQPLHSYSPFHFLLGFC